MGTITMSRRSALGAGVGAVTAAAAITLLAGERADAQLKPQSENIVRQYYAAWEKDDWQPFDDLLADSFTFTSANNDDHISKSAFKTLCWETQKDFIAGFDLQRIFGRGNDVLVMYLGRTKSGKTFRNVEYLQLRDGKVQAIECYFGAKSSFASAVSAKQG